MTPEQRLLRNIKAAAGPQQLAVYQGIVAAVDGETCTVEFASQRVDGVRLRASVAEVEEQLLVVPKVGSAVVVGSLSGDLAELVVLVVDEVERIEINGGKLGGLVNIEPLVDGLNDLVSAFNDHTHTIPTGGVVCGEYPNGAPVNVPKTTGRATEFNREDLEDETVKH
jgi:hypothetical protein